jgi:glycosidase
MKNLSRLFALLIISVLFTFTTTAQDTPNDQREWWKDRIFYQIFVRSFYDSDGDGIGDLRGVIEKLDYLQDLGVSGIWFLPLSPSPSYHGYDVTDYRAINPDYGTMDDFRELIAEAHKRDIAVIIDLVINHSSTEHPWFIDSANNPDGGYADWYIWADENPNFRGPDNQVVWHNRDGRYYYGVFWGGMPDLNYENPDVTAEMYDIARFWIEDVGVDGFRLDAIKHIIEEGRIQENTLSTRAWMAEFNDYVHSLNPDAFLVGEVWSSSISAAPYTDTAVDVVFEFDLAEALISSVGLGVGASIRRQMDTITTLYPEGQYATFLTNHDQNRLMSQLRGNISANKIAASLLFTLPGIPFIYYGEEIGMTGVKPDEQIRTPMQWSDVDSSAGFTTGNPWISINDDWQDGVSFSAQATQSDSLYNHYRHMIELRNTIPALKQGSYTYINANAGTVYSFLRQTDEQTVLVILNMRDRVQENYSLTLEDGTLPNFTHARLLTNNGDISNQPQVIDGNLTEYRPLEALEPLELYIIELSTESDDNAEIPTPDDNIQSALNTIAQQLEDAKAYTSFTSVIDEVSENSSEIYLVDEVVPTFSYNSQSTHITRHITSDQDAITGQVVSEYQVIEGLDNAVNAYQVTTDVRYIDDTYYYLLEIDDEELSQQVDIEGEWQINIPASDIASLPIANLKNTFGESADSLVSYLFDLSKQSSRLTIGSQVIDDITYDTLSFAFNGAEFVQHSRDMASFEPSLNELFASNWGTLFIDTLNQQIDEDVSIITFYINPDQQIAGFSLEIFVAIDLDPRLVDNNSPIRRLNSEISVYRREILTQINQPIPPIEVPTA